MNPMTNEIPQWAQLQDPVLSQAFGEVWQRLPDYAQMHLSSLAIRIREMTDEEAEKTPKTINARTINSMPKGKPDENYYTVIIRPGLSHSETVWLFAHEFAHILLDHTTMPVTLLTDEGRKLVGPLLEDWADWRAAIDWGFMPELVDRLEGISPNFRPNWWGKYWAEKMELEDR